MVLSNDLTNSSVTLTVPRWLLLELRESIYLLLPGDNDEVMQWYKKEARKHHLGTWVTQHGKLFVAYKRISSFKHCRARLIILKRYFDETRPGSLTQLWYDRRDGVRFFAAASVTVTMVLVLLLLVVGIVQIALLGAQIL